LVIDFDAESDLHSCRVRTPLGVRVRPFDLLVASDSRKGNAGPYRVRDVLDDGRLLLRRAAAAKEAGVSAELIHDDGCGLVSGGCCVEVPPGGKAVAAITLPAGTTRLRVSLFFRVLGPCALGTRDRPSATAEAVVVFSGGDGAGVQSVGLAAPRGSFQWQKMEADLRIPTEVRSVRLELRGPGPETVQYTGVYVGG